MIVARQPLADVHAPDTHRPEHPPYPGPTPMPLPEVRVQTPMVFVPATWEYKHHACPVADAGSPATLATLERLGREGWELTGVMSDATDAHFYLKREAR
jgi:hypothetical protein